MRKSTVFAAALALSASTSFSAMADQPGPDWMPMEQVKAKLLSSGYSSITKIEADDGHWDGEGVKNGQTMRFELDPKTGEIIGEAPH